MNCYTVYFIAGIVMGALAGAAVALIGATLYFRKIRKHIFADIDETIEYYRVGVDQFNAGYDAFEAGEPIENCPSFEPDTDEWQIGWAWAQYHALKDGAK